MEDMGSQGETNQDYMDEMWREQEDEWYEEDEWESEQEAQKPITLDDIPRLPPPGSC
jgi:hypothetical protein